VSADSAFVGLGMSHDFYKISEPPFRDSLDLRFLHLPRVYSQLLDSLLENARCGHVQALLGPAGSGKTMLMYAMLERLRNRADTAFVLDVSWGAMALLGFLLNDLGLPDPGPKLEARRETLNRFLLAHRNTAKPVIAVLDNAHNLDHSSLEEIDALLDYAPLSFHVVLAGQIHFTTLLSSLTNPRLVKRVTRWYHLVPLGPKEIRLYVQHRLQTAGYSGDELFTDRALEVVAHETQGLPGKINSLCSKALEYGVRMGKRSIDENDIRQISMKGNAPRLAAPMRREPRSGPIDSSAVKSHPISAEPPVEQNDGFRLAQLLRTWLSGNAGIWSGTAGELYEQLQLNYAADLRQLVISSSADLRQRIDLASGALVKVGVNPEIQTRPGQPRILSLRLAPPGLDSSTPRSTAA
jgi:type II secretory pathway predicted ATPase ExeA